MAVRTAVIGMLLADHHTVKECFAQYEAAPDLSTRRQIAEHAFTALEHHSELEAIIFYPAFDLKATEGERALIDESIQHHEEMMSLIDEMQDMATAYHSSMPNSRS